MTSLTSYFVKDKRNLIANKDNVIVGDKYRFTLLTDRLIRLEYSQTGVFEDRASQNVIFRNFKKVEYRREETETLLRLETKYYILDYDKNKPFYSGKLTPGNNLRVTLKESDKIWYYGHPEARNFGALTYSLDDFSGKLRFDKGLYSTDGFAIIDDSNTYVIDDNDNPVQRESKNIDIYLFMYKKDFGFCLKDYYELTGYPPMISRFLLGNIWYKNDKYSLESLQKVVSKFNDNNINVSSIILGNSWHNNTDFYSFDNINGDELINYLRNCNIKLGLTINPEYGINNQSNLYNGVSSYLNTDDKIINFLPFNVYTISAYLNNIVRPLLSGGVDYFLLDYNNSKDKNNLSLFNHYNYISNSLFMNKRGISISRNTGIAMHRYSIFFTGKTKVDWKTLEVLPFYNVSSSNIGMSWVSHAIGGYYGGIEDSELYIRYVQFGTFSPIFILASEGGKYYKREPWKWDVLTLSVVREYMQLRNKLVPYLYSEAYIYHKSGSPLVQPMYYQYPKIYDEPLYRNQYMFGTEMMVAPIIKKKNVVMNRVVQRVFIPEGKWYHFGSGKVYNGNRYYLNFYKDEDYPVFCKAGSIIPMSLDNNANNPVNMEIQVFPGADGSYKLYEDDGVSLNSNYIITNYEYKYDPNKYNLTFKLYEGRGGSIPGYRNYYVRFRSTRLVNDIEVLVSGKQVQYQAFTNNNDLVVLISNVVSLSEVSITVSGDNLEVVATEIINEDIRDILEDLEIDTSLKDKIDLILFSDISIRKKRIAIRKLKRKGLEPKFITMFISLLEYIDKV
jgi:hypothetical protein